MNNTELYINGKLVDTGGDLGVRLNRKLIDPGALNTIDAQYSYSISLPPTQRNNEAFNYALVEETKNKFNRVYNAQLIVNSVRIFGPGLFRLTSVLNGFKGQLYLPASKTTKDIFGETKLSENAPYDLPFSDFATDVNIYNGLAETEAQPAIFPYILYGLLPKVPVNKNTGEYSARDLWDNTVRFGISDLMPAINPLIMLKHIFNSKGYDLQGTAFQDQNLTMLYQSYRNPSDYAPPWNYGRYGRIHITGDWSNIENARDAMAQLEKGTFFSDDYVTDLFDAVNTKITVVEDPGGNVLYNEVPDDALRTWVNAQIRVPASGYYKVEFNASIHISLDNDDPQTDSDTDIVYIGGGGSVVSSNFSNSIYEMRVCRDNAQGDFGITGAHTDGVFYQKNQPQNAVFDIDNIPKYFPQVDADGQINFVDTANDKNLIVGCMFGKVEPFFLNPKDATNTWAQVYAAKPAYSYDGTQADNPLPRLAINSPGYWKFGSSDQINTEYIISDKYEIELINAPINFAKRGQFAGAAADDLSNGQANAACVVWLEAGELLTVAHVASQGTWRDGVFARPVSGVLRQNVSFELEITPFRTDKEWLKVNTAGNGTDLMNWNDESNFTRDTINLVGFLDTDVKTDDYIDNFCKMWNLGLSQIDARTFSLDIKQNKTGPSTKYVDLENVARVNDCENTALGLPSQYVLGFTIDPEEEGFVETGEDGGGNYETGATEVNVITQTSSFSYNWYKDITKVEPGGDIIISLPVISKAEAWDFGAAYSDAMLKRYTDLAHRFMYSGGILPGTYMFNGDLLRIAQVRNEIPGRSILNYKNAPHTILFNYFRLLIDGASHYTNLKGFLTAVQYALLDGSRYVRFNGDLYYIAEISAYDPYNRNQTTIKLIRKI